MIWFAIAGIAAVTVAAESIADKGALRREDPALFSSIIMVLSALMVLPFVGVVHWSALTWPIFGWITLSSIVFSTALTMLTRAIKHLEISVVAPMSTITPVVAAMLAVAFLGESLNHGQITGMALLVIGGYFLQLKHGQHFLYPIQRIFQCCDIQYLLISLLLYPTFSVMGRYTLNRLGVDPYSYIILIRLLAGLYFAGYLLIAPGGIKTFVTHVPRHKGMLFWIAMLNTVNGTALALAWLQYMPYAYSL
jgi:drug/metabolite transporter (DMT)-like permease